MVRILLKGKKMKFDDIPKFTKDADYQVNQPWKFLLDSMTIYLVQHRLDMNPDFQRGHVWNQKQRIAYVEYILKGGISGRTIYFNHPGWMSDFKGDFVLVDGLQRLTSVMQFLNNKFPVFGYLYKEYTDRMAWNADFVFKINNLKTRKEVLQWYLDLNSGGVIHTKKELDKIKHLLDLEVSLEKTKKLLRKELK